MKDVRGILAHGDILQLLLKGFDQILGKADALLAITEELADGKDGVRVAGDRAVYPCGVVPLALGFGVGGFYRLGLHLVTEETERQGYDQSESREGTARRSTHATRRTKLWKPRDEMSTEWEARKMQGDRLYELLLRNLKAGDPAVVHRTSIAAP